MGFDCKSTSGVQRFIDAPCSRIDFFVGSALAVGAGVSGRSPSASVARGLGYGAPTCNGCVSKTLVLSPNVYRSQVLTDVVDLEAHRVATPQPVVDTRMNIAHGVSAPRSAVYYGVAPTRFG
jgi:hypothetical protein